MPFRGWSTSSIHHISHRVSTTSLLMPIAREGRNGCVRDVRVIFTRAPSLTGRREATTDGFHTFRPLRHRAREWSVAHMCARAHSLARLLCRLKKNIFRDVVARSIFRRRPRATSTNISPTPALSGITSSWETLPKEAASRRDLRKLEKNCSLAYLSPFPVKSERSSIQNVRSCCR